MDQFIDSVANDISADINTLIKSSDFSEDIVITGTPNDMVFEGDFHSIICRNLYPF